MLFDRLIRESVKELFNSLIDALTGTTGAGEVGTTEIEGVTGGDVQTVLGSLKTILDTKSASADMTAALSLKSDKSATDLHFKSVALNANTGVFTFTREDGSFVTIDTVLEKVATNWQYDAGTQSLVLTLADGAMQSVPLSAFITETEFEDSAQIAFSVNDHTVTATVKAGSITDAMLSSALTAQLQGYVSSASGSASAAAQSATAAEGYKNAAAGSATAASGSAGTAAQWATGGTTGTPGAANNAKYYAEQAAGAAATAAEAAAAEVREEMQGYADDASDSAAAAAGSAGSAAGSATAAAGRAAAAAGSASAAAGCATAADGSAKDAEAWAVGQRNGVDVESTDPAYHNNAKYYKDQAGEIAGGDFMLASDYDPDGDVAEDGGIPGYVLSRLKSRYDLTLKMADDEWQLFARCELDDNDEPIRDEEIVVGKDENGDDVYELITYWSDEELDNEGLGRVGYVEVEDMADAAIKGGKVKISCELVDENDNRIGLTSNISYVGGDDAIICIDFNVPYFGGYEEPYSTAVYLFQSDSDGAYGTVHENVEDSVESYVDALYENKQDRIVCRTLTLTTAWSGNGPYTQAVDISGTTENSKVDLEPNSTVLNQMAADKVTALYIENNNGTLTAYAFGKHAPTAALTVQATITEVST